MERNLIIKNIFKVHPFYFLAAFIASVTGNFKGFVIFSGIIIVHEFGHVMMALILKWKIEKVVLLPFGAITIFNEDINRSLKEEALILVFGPLTQVLFTFIYNYFNYSEEFINYSNVLLIFNLLPIFPLDGSKLLNIVLNIFFSFKKSHLITIYISFLTILVVLIKFDFNLILLLIISFILAKVLDEFKNHNNIFNRFLLERYTKDFKFKKNKVIKSMNLGKMKRDYKHIFYDGKRYITEREILKKRFDFHSKTW